MGSCCGKGNKAQDGETTHEKVVREGKHESDDVDPLMGHEIQQLNLSELEVATNKFSERNKIGEGGFGFVYKGRLALSSNSNASMKGKRTAKQEKKTMLIDVAVKRMKTNESFQHEQFLTEILVVHSLMHPNIVRVIGYCTAKGKEACLVYEFMANGNLLSALKSGKDDTQFLNWEQRVKVAKDVAKGLLFIHEKHMIHRDLKSSNILLTHDFTAKIGDLGLIKSCGEESFKSTMQSRILGTQGYIDPIYLETGDLSAKSDVYSYGVVLLELITGVPVLNSGTTTFADQMKGLLQAPQMEHEHFVDPKLEGNYSEEQFIKLVMIANRCVLRDRRNRIDMAYVVKLQNQFL